MILITSFPVSAKTVNKISLDTSNFPELTGKLLVVNDLTKMILCERKIVGGRDVYNTVFQNDGDECKVRASVVSSDISNKKISAIIKEICPIYQDSHFQSSSSSVTAAIATYPARINVLPKAIDSLIGQVEHLFIYLNNFDQVPGCILNHKYKSKITYVLESGSTKRAAAKFYWVDKVKGIHLTCDDDIEYPKNYVSVLSESLKLAGNNSIIGVHSVIYNNIVVDPLSSRLHVFNFKNNLNESQKVHLLGTGTLCFNTSLLNRDGFQQILGFSASTDEWLACFAKENCIDLVTIARKKDWMLSIEGMEHGLHEEKQTNFLLKNKAKNLIVGANPWVEIETPSRNRIAPSVTARKGQKFRRNPRLFFSDMYKNLIGGK
jgi:hypothetical protein